VFLEKALKLSSKIEIEFSLDLLARTGLVSMKPYKMVLAELVNLKKLEM